MLVTSSCVIPETLASLQSRPGMDTVARWKAVFQGILDIVWIDRRLHDEALTAMVAANKAAISLTDRTSFLVMRERDIDMAFSFDRHFARQGFKLLSGRSGHETSKR